MAPWWWFLREPKLVGATSEFLIVLIFLWFYDCVHHCGTIKVLWYCWCTVLTWSCVGVKNSQNSKECMRKCARSVSLLSYIRYNMMWYDVYDMIYLLTASGLIPGGISAVHIYTNTIHRTTKLNRMHTTEHT
jgi:hypothetical protein